MRILFIGDICGRPGRLALRERLGRLIDTHYIDLVVANGENAAAGFGLTVDVADELFGLGIDVLTSGNHIWDKKDILDFLDSDERLLRPANYPGDAPGRGAGIYRTAGGIKVGVINLEGRVFMNNLDCPFQAADRLVEKMRQTTPLILVDFHAEATSEKTALGWHLAGRVSAVVGTHTHCQTSDERIFPNGTAYITDLGMTGPQDSVLGREVEPVVKKFLTGVPHKFDVAKNDPTLEGVIIDVDMKTGKAHSIERLRIGL